MNGSVLLSNSENADFARYRAALYRLASSVFVDEPTKESLVQMIDAAKKARHEDCIRPYEFELFSHIRGYEGEEIAELCTKVRTEYAELFIGPRPPLAPLFESVYVGFPRRLYTETTARVRAFYEGQGLMTLKRNKVPDDHISYELEFMATLCEKEAQAFDDAGIDIAFGIQKVQADFIDKHLGRWTGLFSERVKKAPCADYYAAWSRFVHDFVADDSKPIKNHLFSDE